jgi:hypothetical protein
MPYDDQNHPLTSCKVCSRDFCIAGTDAHTADYCSKECEDVAEDAVGDEIE